MANERRTPAAIATWNKLIDAAFALDEEQPYFGQTQDPPVPDASVRMADFNEDEHPRGPDGKFTSGAGGSASKSTGRKATTDLDKATQRVLAQWTDGNDEWEWHDIQAAARAVIDGKSMEQFAPDFENYDGYLAKNYFIAKRLLEVTSERTVEKPLFRGLSHVDPADFQIGTTFSESLTSWTGKEDLAQMFAEHIYGGPQGENKGTGKVVMILKGTGMHGVNVSQFAHTRISKQADEYLTTGEYRVTKSEVRHDQKVADDGSVLAQSTRTYIEVERIGNAKPTNLRLADWDEAQHPRAEDGKFTTEGGGGATQTAFAYAPVPLHVNAEAQQIIAAAHANGTELAKDAILKALPAAEVAKIQTVLDHGAARLQEFKKLMNDVGVELGVQEAPSFDDFMNVTNDQMFAVGPVKGLDRAAEKVVVDYGGDVTRLNDVVRGTFVVSSAAQAANVLAAFQKRGEVSKIKNRFDTPMAGGYRDMNFLVKLSSGMKAEVQVQTASMLRAKNASGHVIYEKMRTVPEGTPRYLQLLEESERVYSEAWRKDTKRES